MNMRKKLMDKNVRLIGNDCGKS